MHLAAALPAQNPHNVRCIARGAHGCISGRADPTHLMGGVAYRANGYNSGRAEYNYCKHAYHFGHLAAALVAPSPEKVWWDRAIGHMAALLVTQKPSMQERVCILGIWR